MTTQGDSILIGFWSDLIVKPSTIQLLLLCSVTEELRLARGCTGD